MVSRTVVRRTIWCACLLALAAGAVPAAAAAQEHASSQHAAGEHAAHGAAPSHAAPGHPAQAHGEHDEYSLWADLPFWSGVAFIGFVLVIKKLGLWNLLLSSMSDRERAETEAIAMAEANLQAAREQLRQSRGRLEALDGTIQEKLAEAGRDGQTVLNDFLRAAQREAQAAVDRSRHEIERVQDQTLNDLFSTLAEKVALATEQRLRTGLQPADHARLIGEMLDEIVVH